MRIKIVLIFVQMNTQSLFSNITTHIQLTPAQKEFLESLFEERTCKRNTFLLEQGNFCKHIYFVNSGILRAYCVSSNGKESTIMFAVQNWWITDMYCFLNHAPAMVNIKALQNSEVLQLSREGLESAFENIPEFNKFFRILMQNAYCREQLRMIQNLTLPAKERYENFLTKYSFIAERVSLKQIASYIGVTPEFLSSLRAKNN